MRRSAFRRALAGLAALAAVVLLASFAVWRWAEGRLEQDFATWRQATTASGWTVRTGSSARAGWPLSAQLLLNDVSISGGARDLPGGAAYTAARIALDVEALRPTVLVVRAEGRQTMRVGATAPLPFTADRLDLTIPLTQGSPPGSAALDGRDLRFAAPADGLTIGLLEGQADWPAQRAKAAPTTNLRLSVEAVTLPPPPARQAPLGPHIASATVEGTLTGTLPADAQSPAAAAAGWRDEGGKLVLNRIAIGWGPLGVSGSATLALDAALQPEATATLRLIGLEETLSALAAAHTISPHAAQAAKAVVGLLANAPEGGGTPGVEVPLTLRERTVSLGMIPLATVAKLNWSDGS